MGLSLSMTVTPCQVCGTQNPESAELCQRCGAALSASPTMSISSGAAAGRHVPPGPSLHTQQGCHLTPGSVVADRYRVVSLLGRGGMGEVYSAEDLKLGQRVALKFLPAERGKSSSWREQFYAEVRMARQVSHPNVCRVYDVGESEGLLFLSMEFVDGEDLASLLRRIGRLPDDKAVEVAQQLCAGLGAAHRSGVLHRDLKPSNVMIDGKGHARITDFGLAVAASEAAHDTSPAGTPGYVAPELLDGAAPSVQSDLYALGLVLYELFTGKKAFDASNLAEFHRKQTETDPTPPSTVIRNFDPAVERAILRCLDRDPSQRPRSAMSVAASLPGGDPLASALASGETPSPEMVAAAGPQGLLRPGIAWSGLAACVILIFGTSMYLAPRDTDWGLASAGKSPEVLADRAQELTKKLSYAPAVDRAFWIASEQDYFDYAVRNPSRKDWTRTSAEQAWPSSVSFWYRQSPQWMMPVSLLHSPGPPLVGSLDPPYETSGMVALKLDTKGNLLLLRAVPPQVETGDAHHEPDWDLLFTEAGLDKARFVPSPPKWAPPEPFDSRADWEGHFADRPDLPLHVAAAAYRGTPVYFQVIAPWDKASRSGTASGAGNAADVGAAIWASVMVAYVVVGGFFARRNIRRDRGDTKGALRLAAFVGSLNYAYALLSYHFVPQPDYISVQFLWLGIPLLFAMLAWIGYMAVEPYARRTWPKLMVSWQRLLSGRFRDPLIGRDVLVGILAGSATSCILIGASGLAGISQTFEVHRFFGHGIGPCVGLTAWQLSLACSSALIFLGVLAIATGLLRRRWLGLAATAPILTAFFAPTSAVDLALAVLYVIVFLFVLTRIGLVAAASFILVFNTLAVSPPFTPSQWYAGRAIVALLIPLTLLGFGFYISLGSQRTLDTVPFSTA